MVVARQPLQRRALQGEGKLRGLGLLAARLLQELSKRQHLATSRGRGAMAMAAAGAGVPAAQAHRASSGALCSRISSSSAGLSARRGAWKRSRL